MRETIGALGQRPGDGSASGCVGGIEGPFPGDQAWYGVSGWPATSTRTDSTWPVNG